VQCTSFLRSLEIASVRGVRPPVEVVPIAWFPTMPSIQIRDALERDVSALTELSRFVHDIHAEAHPAYFKPFEPRAIAEQFRTRLLRQDTRIRIASLGELPVGYVVVLLRDRPEDARCFARRSCEIEEIAVAASHRRHGVARALIEDVHREARSLGIGGVELASWSFNATAHAAFQALGFAPMLVRFRHQS